MNKKITCDGQWNGYYIEASQEAYDLLVADGYGISGETKKQDIREDTFFCILRGDVDNQITKNEMINDHEYRSCKPLYIVDGKLSATQYNPEDVAFKGTKVFNDTLNDAFTVTEKEYIVGDQYEHLKCDTVEWSKQNHTLEQQKAICQFMINKYITRNKGQDEDDIVKARFYLKWLEEIIKKEIKC